MSTQPAPIFCGDGCKRTATPAEAESGGWFFLPISRRYRCPACWRELKRVNETEPTTS
jgi:hypothetical protein